jgi:hypothetical protein
MKERGKGKEVGVFRREKTAPISSLLGYAELINVARTLTDRACLFFLALRTTFVVIVVVTRFFLSRLIDCTSSKLACRT